jgi:2-methylcitrate dehydratase PrpD
MSEPVTQLLAEALSSIRAGDIPAAVLDDTRRTVLDWLGSALAGSLEPPARMAQRVAAGFGTSNEATVFSCGRGSAAAAAFANGVASHILELDDVHKGSTLHGAAPIIPAALAVAEREHIDGAAFLRAVAIGYEAALRIGEAVNPSHYRFWHPTGTAATFGAAAAAGALLHLNSDQMRDALGSAGTQAAGLWEFNADGSMSKHLHPGKAAMNGILAADLARAGFTGASRILEGDRGFLRAMSQNAAPSRITDGLGAHWKISENCFKLHSCCGHTHTAIDTALALRPPIGIRVRADVEQTLSLPRRDSSRRVFEGAGGIRSIHIETYGPGYEIVKEMRPRTPYQEKFSIAYCVAAALMEGRVGLEQFGVDRFDLLARTQVTVADDLTAKYPSAWPARLAITMENGEVLFGGADYPRGNPENPVSTAELRSKFQDLVTPRCGGDAARRALAAVDALDDCPDMALAFSQIL